MTSPDPAAEGRRRADEYLALVGQDDAAATALLAGLADVRELVFLGAGLTAIARTEARFLPPAQRAQANTRQVRLGEYRDSQRNDLEGLRSWLRQAAEEIVLIRGQQAVADRVIAADQEWTATRAAAEAGGTATAGGTTT